MTKAQTLNVVVRRVIKTGALELFYVNCNESARCWWIEGFAPGDGHFQPTRDYVQRETEPVRLLHKEADKLVQDWAALGMLNAGFDTVRGMRLNGPRGFYYSGE